MAEAVPFKEQNATLMPPVDTKECLELPVYSSAVAEGGEKAPNIPYFVSKWKLTQAEVDEVVRTGEIWLFVASKSHPPICVESKSPFQVMGETKDPE